MIDFKKVLVKFDNKPEDHWTIDDAMKGISIIGGTGSGKTSASGKTLATQFLKQGWGGLVLCAKTDEADLWRQYCAETGRLNDLIIFSKNGIVGGGENKGQTIVFNPIDYELNRGGEGAGETQNLTNIFMNIYKLGNRISGDEGVREERYWDAALKRCLNRVIELLKLAGESLTYQNMAKVIKTSNKIKRDDLDTAIVNYERGDPMTEIDLKSKYCLGCLYKAYLNNFYDRDDYSLATFYSYENVEDYFLVELPEMGDKTRSVVTESFMGLAEPFFSGLLFQHFSGKTNIYPEWIYMFQKIIVLDFPIKEFLEAGIIAQSVFKLIFQQAIERRNVKEYPIPAFLWIDEAHYFTNPYDQIFLTTARSSRTATVFLSQSISNYYAIMGGNESGKAKVDSLMGNLSTKIFHANSDAVTNEYASKLIGDAITFMTSRSSSSSLFALDFTRGKDWRPELMPQVQPKDFTMLKGGGEMNNFEVEAFVFATGKQWSTGTNYLKTIFTQHFKQ